jgi:signal transduction histidine kinase/Tfp pilus assembly protein PilF
MNKRKPIRWFKKLSALFILMIFSAIPPSLSANAKEDSLKSILANTEDDSLRVEILLHLGKAVEGAELGKSEYYYTEALKYEMADSIRADLLYSLGMIFLRTGENTKATEQFLKAKDLFEALNDSTRTGRIYNNLGVASYWLGNSNEALTNYHRSLEIRRVLNDHSGVSKVLNNIGMIYQDWGLFNEALEWHEEALQAISEAGTYSELAYCYSNIGACYKKLEQFDLALSNYRKGHNYVVKVDEQNRENSYFFSFFGETYREMAMRDSALHYFLGALDYARRINNTNRIAQANYNLGKIHLEMDKPELAREYLNLSYSASLEDNYLSLKRDNLFALSELAEQEGNTGKALDFLKQATALRDSLFNTDELSKFTDLQIKYFTEKQTRENLLLKQKNEIQEIAIRQQKLKTRILIISGIFILAILFFITRSRVKLKKMSARLEKSEKELLIANAGKDKFFTLIAHDLKSPFNGLLGVTEILAENFDELPTAQTKKLILELRKSVTNVFGLVEGLLSWAQIQTGKIEYRVEKADLFKLAEEVTEQLETSAKNKNITLEQNIGEHTFAVADKKSVSTVFRNLISNAIKYTNTRGLVKIEAAKKDGCLEISVEDNGIGMNQETLKKLFTITEKNSEAGTANETGTGLGLILCKEFIEKNNGKIWVESEPGKGSRFVFTLPAAGDKNDSIP